ncbi:unnamed protein product [Heterobilharzia americana]|nr:unnamed protein product [Heterobilharzia americana]
MNSTQPTPIFPVVLFPRYQSTSSKVSIDNSLNTVSNQERRVFSLIYEVNSTKINVDYLLEIHTDPIQVVCQPELLRQVTDFVRSAMPSKFEASTRRAQANLRSLLKDITGEHLMMINSQDSQNRWAIHFDLAAPRMLIPNCFMYNNNNNNNSLIPDDNSKPTSVKCLLCDFGHLKVTNWPEIQATPHPGRKCDGILTNNVCSVKSENWVNSKNESSLPTQTLNGEDETDDDDDNDDDYRTPCSTPAELSEADEEEDVASENAKESRRCDENNPTDLEGNVESTTSAPMENNYASYMINVENIRVLVGSLDTFEKLGLWNRFSAYENLVESKDKKHKFLLHDASFSSDGHSVLRMSKSALVSRLCLINPFNLSLLINRRMYPLQDTSPIDNKASTCPPYLKLSLKQESCVIQLSNTKIYDFFSCLIACRRYWNDIQPIKLKHVSKSFNRSRTHSLSYSHSLISNKSTPSMKYSFKEDRLHHNSLSIFYHPPSCRKSANEPLCHRNKKLTELLPVLLNTGRKRILATYSIQSFIIQFESQERPLAECRLGGTVCNVSVYHGSQVGFHLQFRLGSISVVDAVSNLGGVYDVILSSEKLDRTDSADNQDGGGHFNSLKSSSSSSSLKECSSFLSDDEFKPFISSVQECDDFVVACLTWFPSINCLDRSFSSRSRTLSNQNNELLHHIASKSLETYFIQLHLRCLNITGNPRTILAINRFVNEVYSSVISKQSNLCENLNAKSTPKSSIYHYEEMNNRNDSAGMNYRFTSTIDYSWHISMDSLRILLLNQSVDNLSSSSSVKEIANVIFSGVCFELDSSDISYSVSLKLHSFQLLPLCNSKIQVGQCLLSSLSTSSDNLSTDLLTIQVNWPLSNIINSYHNTSQQIQIILSNIVYIHSIQEIFDVFIWFKSIFSYFHLTNDEMKCSFNDEDFLMNDYLKSNNNNNNSSKELFPYLEFHIQLNNILILIPCISDPFIHFILFGFNMIEINHCLPIFTQFNPSLFIFNNFSYNKNNTTGVQLHFSHFGVFHYINKFTSIDQSLSSEKKLQINFSSLQKFWFEQNISYSLPIRCSQYQTIIAPMNFYVYINYATSNLSRNFIPNWLNSVRFNFSDLSMVHEATVNITKNANFENIHSKINSSSSSSCSNVNLLLFTEIANTQLTIELDIESVYINLTKMNCSLLMDIFHDLFKEYNSLNDEDMSQLKQTSSSQPSFINGNSIHVGQNDSIEFGIHLNCPKIHVVILADLDITPIPLALLTLDSLVFSSSFHIPNGITLPSCLQLNINSIYLDNRLTKPEYGKNVAKNVGSLLQTKKQFLLACKASSSKVVKESNENLKRRRKSDFSSQGVYDTIYSTQCQMYFGAPSNVRKRSLSSCIDCRPNQVSPIFLRIILLSDQHGSFCQAKYFIKFTIDTLDFQLLSEPWVLLLDFFNLCDYEEDSVTQQTCKKSNQDPFHSSNSNPSTVSNLVFNDVINSSKFAFLLNIDFINGFFFNSDENTEECSNNSNYIHRSQILTSMNTETDLALITFTGIKAQINDFGVDDSRNHALSTFVNYPCFEVKGYITNLKLIALPKKYAHLYQICFISPYDISSSKTVNKDNISQLSFLTFQFTKKAKHFYESSVDSVDEEDAYISIHLPNASYIHTQSFLMNFIDALHNFVEHYNFLRRTRGCVKGFQIPTVVSSSRIRLNISGGPLNLVIPVSYESSKVLVLHASQFNVYNKFLWSNNGENVNHSSDSSKSSCSLTADNRYFLSRISSCSKSNRTGLLECSGLNSCERVDSFNDMINEPSLDGVIHFPDYSFIPTDRFTSTTQCNSSYSLFDPIKCVNLILERNLTSGKPYILPDWKLTGWFSNCQVYMSPNTYRSIRGVLSHNFGEYTVSGTVTANQFAEDNRWTKFAIDIYLKSIQIILLNSSASSVTNQNNRCGSNQFGVIDFCDALLSFEYFSNQSTTIQLQCFDLNLLESQGDTDKENTHYILQGVKTGSSTEAMKEEKTSKESERISKLIICSNYSLYHSAFIFSSTELHLLLNWEWLMRLNSFIILPPLSSGIINMPCISTSERPTLSSVDYNSGEFYSTRSVSKSQICFNGSNDYNNRVHKSKFGLSSTDIQHTYLHICIEDSEVCIPHGNMSLLLKLSTCFSRQTSIHSLIGILSDIIQADIHYLRLYHDYHSIFIISSPLKFSSNLYHSPIDELSPSSSQLSSIFNNNKKTVFDLMKLSLLHNNLNFTYPVKQRNFLHHTRSHLQLEMFLIAPAVHITSKYSDIQLIKDVIDHNCDNWQTVHDTTLDPQAPKTYATEKSVLSTFWPKVFANYISKQLMSFDLNVESCLYLFATPSSTQLSVSSEEIPLIKLCVEGVKVFWRQSDLQANLHCSGISCFYYNQYLVAWEPVLEPLSCSLNWAEKLEQDFSRTISLHCTSQQCLKLNLTVPFIQLFRRILNPVEQKRQSHPHNEMVACQQVLP